MLSYSFLSVISGIFVYSIIIFFNYIKTSKPQFRHFEFSKRNYYIMMSPFIIGLLAYAIAIGSIKPILVFIIFALAGVFGETFFSVIWDSLFDKRFWIYRVDTLYKSYSSLLNFIPWGVGGFLYLSIVDLIKIDYDKSLPIPFYFFMLVLFTCFQIIIFIVAYFSKRRRKINFEFRELNIKTYIFFILPIISSIIIVSIIYSIFFIVLFVVFGLVAFISEYLFGKMCTFFISKKLWYYTYYTIDNKHTTPLNIVPFGIAGFYFWSAYLIIFS
ncbi:MAG: hypothetical protein US52_C0005G0009 [candidate division WS6 bacterium GW2011_GWA2_37_6]|uniref:Uncharacterized protein n=1 Tax=candidate division WS6 bacterium GW2011_GWA2_37_6 TaxID=1619087 RepID=A0A0G0JHG9_9BACT|nr:MAG: hypothetical protein US52_C0005G0009 [candidate division WS6 bacterium GW2011_GWA2_37_6]